jgi:tripartite-type tricarboxylate transporter receptor subunit TctC
MAKSKGLPPMLRRSILTAAALGLAAPAFAQARPLRMIIPVGVGGVTDVVGRILADALQTQLGRPVVPENIAGAGIKVSKRRWAGRT